MFPRARSAGFAACAVATALALVGAPGCKGSSTAPEPSFRVVASEVETTWHAPGVPQRAYTVYASTHADPEKRAPVIVALHGFGGNGAGLVQYFGLKAVAEAHGALIVVPTANRNHDGSTYWNAGGACCDWYDEGSDDVAYLDAVLDDVATHFRIDPKRVYVVGHSNGGFMAYWYACKRAERVAAIVSLAGANLADPAACRPSGPVAVLQAHGDTDDIVPYAGGDFSSPELFLNLRRHGFRFPPGGIHAAAFMGAHQSMDAWGKTDGCSADPETLPPRDLDVRIPGAETIVTRYVGCPAAGAELWTLHGGSHVPSLAPSFGEDLYGFLMAHPKR